MHEKTLNLHIATTNLNEISGPTWNDEFDWPNGSYSVSDIQDYFEYIINKHETIPNNPPVQTYVDKIKNRIVFKIKTGYKLELLSSETMKILGSKNKDVDKDGVLVPKLGSVKVILRYCNFVNNNYQQASEVLFTFVPSKQFGQLITIAPHSLTIFIH